MEFAFSFHLPKGNGRNGQEEPGNAKASIIGNVKKSSGKGGQRDSSLAAFGRFGRVLAERVVEGVASWESFLGQATWLGDPLASRGSFAYAQDDISGFLDAESGLSMHKIFGLV